MVANDSMLNEVLYKLKKIKGIGKVDNAKILIDTNSKLPNTTFLGKSSHTSYMHYKILCWILSSNTFRRKVI